MYYSMPMVLAEFFFYFSFYQSHSEICLLVSVGICKCIAVSWPLSDGQGILPVVITTGVLH